MAKCIKARYIHEEGNYEEYVLLMAHDLVLEVNGGEFTFRKVPAVGPSQKRIEIDLNECPVFSLAFPVDLKVDMEWLQKANFLEVIRMLTLANKKGGN